MAGFSNPSALGLSSVALFRPSSLDPVIATANGESVATAAEVQTAAMMPGGLSARTVIIGALIVGALWYASRG